MLIYTPHELIGYGQGKRAKKKKGKRIYDRKDLNLTTKLGIFM